MIVSNHPESFKGYIPEKYASRFFVTSSSLKNVNGYLNAANLSFLIREESPINWVASPVKFSKYSMTGLVVVAEDTVAQVVDFGRRIGNVISARSLVGKDLSTCEADHKKRAECAKQIYSKKKFTERLLIFYEIMN